MTNYHIIRLNKKN